MDTRPGEHRHHHHHHRDHHHSHHHHHYHHHHHNMSKDKDKDKDKDTDKDAEYERRKAIFNWRPSGKGNTAALLIYDQHTNGSDRPICKSFKLDQSKKQPEWSRRIDFASQIPPMHIGASIHYWCIDARRAVPGQPHISPSHHHWSLANLWRKGSFGWRENRWIFFENGAICKANCGNCIRHLMIFSEDAAEWCDCRKIL